MSPLTEPLQPPPKKAKRGRPRKLQPEVCVPAPDSFMDHQGNETHEEQNERVKCRLFDILGVTEKFDAFKAAMSQHNRSQIKEKEKEQQESEGEVDSDDALSEAGIIAQSDLSHHTMDGDTDYRAHPLFDKREEYDDQNSDEDEQVGEKLLDVSLLKMVPDNIHNYEEEGKDNETWWLEDSTRETTMCLLWQEEESLYNVTSDGHRIPSNRATILKKFSIILQMPRK